MKGKTDDQIFRELVASPMKKVTEGDIKGELKISIQLILSSKKALNETSHSKQLYTSEKICTSTTDFIFKILLHI